MIDQASHLIDLARWFLGDLVLAYSALPTYFWKVSLEDNCFPALRAAGGQQAWLHASWTERKNLFCLEIYGRDGKLQVDGLGGSYGTERLAFYRMLPELGPPEAEIREFPSPDESWRAEFAEFALVITENRRPEGNLDDALADVYKKLAEQEGLARFEIFRRFNEFGSPEGLAETEQFLRGAESTEP